MTATADLEAELHAAIERLYSVFARYPLRPDTWPCPSCITSGLIDTESVSGLQRISLRELTLDDLHQFIDSSLSTWGTVDDYRHFLPRMMELFVGRMHDWYFTT